VRARSSGNGSSSGGRGSPLRSEAARYRARTDADARSQIAGRASAWPCSRAAGATRRGTSRGPPTETSPRARATDGLRAQPSRTRARRYRPYRRGQGAPARAAAAVALASGPASSGCYCGRLRHSATPLPNPPTKSQTRLGAWGALTASDFAVYVAVISGACCRNYRRHFQRTALNKRLRIQGAGEVRR
jgi:hypothetical protein